MNPKDDFLWRQHNVIVPSSRIDTPDCPRCLNGFEKLCSRRRVKTKVTEHGEITITIRDVLSAADKNCPDCRFLMVILNAAGICATTPRNQWNVTAHWFCRPLDYEWMAGITLDQGQERRTEIALGGSSRSEGTAVLQQTFSPDWPAISGDTGSIEAVARTLSWITRCSEDHINCRKASSTMMPTRVLRISGPNNVSLYEPTHNESGLYACLSHCWGGQPLLETTTTKVRQFIDSIPWYQLPRTFKDAIQFTHQLGLEFLWIDSLCIVQDSQEDWQHESSKMASIYEGSYLTLSAAVSPNAASGLFRKSQLSTACHDLTYGSPCGDLYHVKCRVQLDHVPNQPGPILLGRAWAYQERILSSRILHFMDEELWFECCEGFSCECFQMGSDRVWQMERPWTIPTKPNIDKVFRKCLNSKRVEEQWRKMVEGYSFRTMNLTYPNDVFPALQGLAKTVPSFMGAYLAGHWEKYLVQSLRWHTTPEQARPLVWRAPSWSWASINDLVHWPSDLASARPLLKIIRHQTVPEGFDPTGKLISGEIEVAAHTLRGHVAYYPAPNDQYLPFVLPAFIMFTDGEEQVGSHRAGDMPIWDYRIDFPGPHHVADSTPIIVARLESSPKESSWLVLIAVNKKRSLYNRIGLLSLSKYRKKENDFSDQLNALYQRYAEKRVITII